MSNTQFALSLDAWQKKTAEQLAALGRVASQDLAERVIDDTPIDTGNLVGNWQPSINAPNLEVSEAPTNNVYAQSALVGTIPQLKAGDRFYYTNATAYARRIEFGFVGPDALGRVYNQAGRYMVTKAVAAWDGIVAAAAAKLGLKR
jgi:hypothetical protein